jgi:mannitol-1-phosphate 5-dehydrogenase
MKTMVQFGAGNIGRSFIGRLFAEAGYEVVFIDVDRRLVGLLNERKSYPVVVKAKGEADKTRMVEGFRAVDGNDAAAVRQALVSADYVATSVGQRALQAIMPLIASAVELRWASRHAAMDIIIAENIRSGAEFFRAELAKQLPAGFDLRSSVGLVETSIGKMVPIMPREALEQDPLQLFAEPYDTLIVDRRGFRNSLPPLAGLMAVENITAYVDRKLFMHNMSHAATAYLGYQADPSIRFIWQATEMRPVFGAVRGALSQSSAALVKAYPDTFDQASLDEYAEELLERYRNRALGDTVYRVGRDRARKLSRNDRLIGACLLASGYGLPFDCIARAVHAALSFGAVDEAGQVGPADRSFAELVAVEGDISALQKVSTLDPCDPREALILNACLTSKRGA